MDNQDFNKRCAVVLKWPEVPTMPNCFHVPKEFNTSVTNDIMPARTMHFHDSYDWAMLLVKEVVKAGFDYDLYYHDNCGYLTIGDNRQVTSIESMLTPLQISTAALSVLETANE